MEASAPADTAERPALHTDRPQRLMVIVAHPDDADFGPAATVAGWIKAGTVARLVCLTSGDAGGEDAALDPLQLAQTREAEQRAAAAIVGYEDVIFLHRPDGALENDLPLREQLVRLIREFRPDAVMTMDPTVLFHSSGYIQHTDHRAAGMSTIDAVYPAARNPMAFAHLAREGLEAHSVERLYLFFSDQPNATVDVSETFDIKIAALRAHVSQLPEPEETEGRMREWATSIGDEYGVEAAESFRILDIA